MKRLPHPLIMLLTLLAVVASTLIAQETTNATPSPQRLRIYDRDNLVVWCIVPFDSRKRNPQERAAMMKELGFKRFAYDWRAEHVATFDEEIRQLKAHGIELTGFWFPASLNEHARAILDALERNKVRTQLWITAGDPAPASKDLAVKVKAAADQLRPIVEAAAKIGCKVGLYNHGGWFGEPENQIAIIQTLKADNVGIVYNLHHGHDHIDRFPALLAKMKPHLYCLNLNGMVKEGDRRGMKILPLGAGDLERGLMQAIVDSGYDGPIGILGHTQDDARERLADNLAGLDWLLPQLAGKPAGEKPVFRTWKTAIPNSPSSQGGAGGGSDAKPPRTAGSMPGFGQALATGIVVESGDAFRKPPITVELWAKLDSKRSYNILVASDTKQSAAHWEIFTENRSGHLCVYVPGSAPDHVRTTIDITDGQWHHVAMTYEPTRIRLHLDGKQVADQRIEIRRDTITPGGLGVARLVEGGLGCDGLVDDLRITQGVREITGKPQKPAAKDEKTIGLWDFEEVKAIRLLGAVERDDATARNDSKYWRIEDVAERAKLPEYLTIPAAKPEELTPANGLPTMETYQQWSRSHGDAGAARYGHFDQINTANVHKLQVAWTYHSKDGVGNIQCNPVIVDGVMFTPTVGHQVVAVNIANGKELWRFKPQQGRPAHRGLLHWKGEGAHPARLLFTAGPNLYALDPATGKVIESFGNLGLSALPGPSVAGPVVAKGVIIVPGEAKDVWGFDVVTGRQLWTFHTLPQPGEFGHETWDKVTTGANCWGGLCADEARGIAYLTTGSPKPNFMGMLHRGDNLFANCLIALDVVTGRRLWHFQEIRHDIWDLDTPAPPNLVTITREGRRIDAVAAVTKIGNTLLLDRVTGKPIFPFRLRRAPTSTLPGEVTATHQPDVELPEPFARQVFTLDDVTDRSEDARKSVMGQLRNANMGWFAPLQENRPTVFYGIHGGAEWTGASIDPVKGHLFVTANEVPWIITLISAGGLRPADTNTPGEKVYLTHCAKCHGNRKEGAGVNPSLLALGKRFNNEEVLALLTTGRNLMPPIAKEVSEQERRDLLDFLFDRDLPASAKASPKGERPNYAFLGFQRLLDSQGYPGCKPPWGTLNCLDLNTGRLLWKVPLGEYPEFAYDDIPKTGMENFGGSMTTAGGLVFAAGTRDQMIRAFDAKTGKELWKHKLPFGGFAPPATCMHQGRQYVIIPATGGGKLGGPMGDAFVAFVLPQ